MQRTIKATLAEKLGLNIERDDVIQTLGWQRSSYGYRQKLDFCCAKGNAEVRWPLRSIVTNSPGSISLINSAFTISKAQVSDAST